VICALVGIAPGYDMREELNDRLPQWSAAPDSALGNTDWPVGGRTPTDPALRAGCARLRGISR